MEDEIVDVDRSNGDIIVAFKDGTVVRYTAALLREMIDRAEVLPSDMDPEPVD